MKNILFVGEHPAGSAGNSKMLRGVLSQIDGNQYSVSCFVSDNNVNPGKTMFEIPQFSIITTPYGDRRTAMRRLLGVIQAAELDYLIMVGIDIWQYCAIFPDIQSLAREKDFKFIAIFPYDIQELRSDWVSWIKNIDYPCVYSQYGYDKLKPEVPNIRYFRPPFQIPELWKPLPDQARREVRRRMFPMLPDDSFIFGFIGPNQVRKDPQRLIKAFSIVKKEVPSARLYLHTTPKGFYNLRQCAEDYGIDSGELLMKKEGNVYPLTSMPALYNALDCFVNCSLQEGLSWTTLEAMLCGVPVIASDSTAHTELLEDVGCLVNCDEMTYIPLYGVRGSTWMEAKACDPEDMAEAMLVVMSDQLLRDKMSLLEVDFALGWLSEVSDINTVFEEIENEKIEVKETELISATLFAQHSAGGDILMTTRCLEVLKARRPYLPLHYMTQEEYFGILKNNPYIDKLIPWDDNILGTYLYSYNPHGDRILPGHWGRNSNSILADFYWKVLLLDEPGDFFIHKEKPDFIEITDSFPEKSGKQELTIWDRGSPRRKDCIITGKICVVHTTGGDSYFRTYKYMKDVCDGLRKKDYFAIQIGGANDYPAGASYDLRGLNYNQNAWIMSQAELAITVDSFASHLAGALGVSQVALYGSGNAAVVQPRQVGGELICLSPDYVNLCLGLGPCSGQVRECPTPCTGSHDPQTILDAVDELIRRERDFDSLNG